MLQPDTRGMTNPLESANTSTSLPSPDPAAPSPRASTAKDKPISVPPPPSPGLFQRLWILVVRLLILGMGISLGWIAGLLVAQVWPSRNPNPPLQERVMRQTSQTMRKVRQLPQWWRGEDPAVSTNVNPTPEAESLNSTPNPAPPDPSPLSQEVVSLQQQLASLENRLAELEQQTGQAGTGNLSERLQQLAQQAAANGTTTATPRPAPAEDKAASEGAEGNAEAVPPGQGNDAGAESTEAATAATLPPGKDGLGRHAAALPADPQFPLVSDRIGLPSALLFEPESSLLTPTGKQLLDAIVPDLRRFGAVTLLVGSHTDGNLSAEEARQITFQQALAVQTYLAAQLEDAGNRWLTVGYGKTRPVALGDAPGTEARNQRLDIGIVQP